MPRTRCTNPVLPRIVDARPPAWRADAGLDVGDAFAPPTGTATAGGGGDGDGLPDAWERAHGTDPRRTDGASLALGRRPDNGVAGCTPGYTALECYLNELAERVVAQEPDGRGAP